MQVGNKSFKYKQIAELCKNPQNKCYTFVVIYKMKKFITAILAVLYLGTSTGATIHMHYCMGKLADWGLGHNKSKTCGKCGMEKSNEKDNGCCKDEHKFLKDDSAQKVTESNLQLMQLMATALPSAYIQLPELALPSLTEESPNSNAPPRTQAVPVYIRNCVFRI